jgi:21S rRNA (GM2251-2'-O)-methyltransferase
LKLLENAGYEHLYGISPVLNALKANQRNFANPDDEDEEDLNDLLELQERLSSVDGIDNEFSKALEDELLSPDEKKEEKREIKPEAKLAPYLFVQEGTLDNTKRSFRSDAKIQASSEIVALAKDHRVPLAEVDKGVLNTLCGNRPHQGFVLRCGGLNFEQLRSIPSATGEDAKSNPLVWLALDEVVDPQNLGALLRSVYFLGGGERVGVLVTAKNSSPLSPTVSASSSGALEFMTVYSTSNLPKMLNNAKDNGWRVLGAAAEVPTDKRRDYTGGNDWDIDVEDDGDGTTQQQQQTQQCYELNDVETQKPTILVLGSEGRGLRTLVARACSSFVKIPGGVSLNDDDDSQAGVDSLNVSVTGGILLWHFLSGGRT